MPGAEKAAVSAGCRNTEHLIVGGGLAGSMLAMRLAGAGREVTLLEKERCAHHKVCGEFLSREAVAYLRQAGVDPLELGAVSIDSVRLRKPMFRNRSFSIVSMSCLIDRARRSSFHTISVSPLRA